MSLKKNHLDIIPLNYLRWYSFLVLKTFVQLVHTIKCLHIMNQATKHSNLIKTEAKRLGFMSCGISKAGFLEEEAPRLEKWLKDNRHGEMHYMENHFDKRLDSTKLVDD